MACDPLHFAILRLLSSLVESSQSANKSLHAFLISPATIQTIGKATSMSKLIGTWQDDFPSIIPVVCTFFSSLFLTSTS
ncbi:hypothetical protein F5051DRAFT_415098, partial [Lentinula edodes]